MKKQERTPNIAISREAHKLLIEYSQKSGVKMGNYVDRLLKMNLYRELTMIGMKGTIMEEVPPAKPES